MNKKEILKLEINHTSPHLSRRDAIQALVAYLKKYNLDPEKSWDKDPIHGKYIGHLYQIIRTSEEMIRHQMADLIKPEVHPHIRKVKNADKYDYPDVDGKPMSSQMKKKYRAKMRSLLKAQMDEGKAKTIAMAFASQWNNVDDPTTKIARKYAPETGREATIEYKARKAKQRKKRREAEKKYLESH